MAQRLPDASVFGNRPQLQSRNVTEESAIHIDRGELQTAQAVSNLGRTLGDIGQRMQDREDRLNYVQQKSVFLQKSVETESKFDGDTDYKTFGSRYAEDMTKAKQEALTKIKNPVMRAEAEADMDLDIQQGVSRMAAKSWGMEKSNGVAGMNETIARNRQLYLTAKDDATRTSILNNSKQAIEMARANGYVSPDEAEELGRKSAQDYAVGRVSVLPADQQIATLKQAGGVADFIPADMKQAMLEKAESESITNLRNQEWMAQQQREKIFNAGSLLVEQTGSVAGIPPEQWALMDDGQRKNLLNDARDISEGKHIPTDWEIYTRLKTQAAQPETRKAFEREDLTKYYPKLNPTERKELIGIQAKLREGKNDKSLDTYLGHKQIVDQGLNEIGIDPSPKPGTTAAKQVANFHRQVGLKIIELQADGKSVSDEQVQTIVDNLIIKGRVPNTGTFYDDRKRRFELKPGQGLVVEDIEQVPAADRAKIEDSLRRLGKAINDQNIIRAFNGKLAKEL